MKALVLLNAKAGRLGLPDGSDPRQQITRAFADAGAEAEVRVINPRQIENTVRDALTGDIDAIIAAGGDGIVNLVANAIADSRKTLGVLPLGASGELARTLGIPLDLKQAAEALAHGRTIDLPVCEVNGRLFLNYSAVGLPPEIVRVSERLRDEPGRGDWPKLALSASSRITLFPARTLRLGTRGRNLMKQVPGVIVRAHSHETGATANSSSVHSESLFTVHVAVRTTRMSLGGILMRTVTRRIERTARDIENITLAELRIDSSRKKLAVVIDGMIVDIRPPLFYRIRPRALRVLAPQANQPMKWTQPAVDSTRQAN